MRTLGSFKGTRILIPYLPFFSRADRNRGLDAGLHPVRVRRPRRVRGHPLQEADQEGRGQGERRKEGLVSLKNAVSIKIRSTVDHVY